MNATKQTMVNCPIRDTNGHLRMRQCKPKLKYQRPIKRYHIDDDLLGKTELLLWKLRNIRTINIP